VPWQPLVSGRNRAGTQCEAPHAISGERCGQSQMVRSKSDDGHSDERKDHRGRDLVTVVKSVNEAEGARSGPRRSTLTTNHAKSPHWLEISFSLSARDHPVAGVLFRACAPVVSSANLGRTNRARRLTRLFARNQTPSNKQQRLNTRDAAKVWRTHTFQHKSRQKHSRRSVLKSLVLRVICIMSVGRF